jgi:hypothetical protein
MVAVFRDVLEDRRKQPRQDLVSILAESELDGERLSHDGILAFYFLLVHVALHHRGRGSARAAHSRWRARPDVVSVGQPR